MEPLKTIKERFGEARRLEQSGDASGAAAIYQKLVDHDPEDEAAVARLLVMYRKLKDYSKELAVIDAVLAAYARRNKDMQATWLKEHPKAAGAGRSILKQLGGARLSRFGVNQVVSRLQQRRELVARRLSGAKKPKPKKRGAAADQRKVAAERRKAIAERSKSEAAERKQVAAAAKAAAKAAADAKAAQAKAAAKAARAAKATPSLFIISVRYLVYLDEIDAAMPQHMAFLRKNYANGHFIVSGRQVPRTGGIIIANGKSREAVESLMKNDPFVKKKLASIDIVEFTASQVGKGWKKLVPPTP
jgi:uncharacterized protein YciI